MHYVAPTLSPLSSENACPLYNRLTFDRLANSGQKRNVIDYADLGKKKAYTNKPCKWTKGKSVIYGESLKDLASKLGKTASAVSKALCGNRPVGGGIVELVKK